MLCVVDPDISDRQAVAAFISRIGYRVEQFATAASLLGREQADDRIDAVVAELVLPDMNGLELARLLRSRFPGIAVIILTGSSDVDSAVQAYKHHVDAYIPKPFVERSLATCLMQLVGSASESED